MVKKPLPGWAEEIGCKSWAQFVLKFIGSHPAVTCAIPATTRVDHVQENMGAAYGGLPDETTRARMARYVEMSGGDRLKSGDSLRDPPETADRSPGHPSGWEQEFGLARINVDGRGEVSRAVASKEKPRG